MQKNEIGLLPYIIHKINSKWIKDLDVGPGITKLLEVNKGKISLAKVLTIIFLHTTPKAKAIKTKINKWGHIKLKSFNLKRNCQQILKSSIKNRRKYFQSTYLIKD